MAGSALAWPLFVAVAAAINADSTVAALLAGEKVYNTLAPAGSRLDYVVLGGGVSESEMPLLMRGASTAVLTLHWFTEGADNRTALALWGELHRVLHRRTLSVTGYAGFTGSLALVDVQPDADGRAMHGIARYTVNAVRT